MAVLDCERSARRAPPAARTATPTSAPAITRAPEPTPAGIAPAPACIPGFSHAVFGKRGVALTGFGHTDSYDSAIGGTFRATDGNIGTASVNSCAIALGGSTRIHGDVAIGVAGTPAASVCTSGTAAATTTSTLEHHVALPSVTVPVVGRDQGDLAVAHGTTRLAPDQTYGAVVVTGSAVLQLDAGTYVMASLTVGDGARLVVGSGPVAAYVTASLDLAGVANPSLVAGNLVILGGPTASAMRVRGGRTAALAIYAPDSDIAIAGDGDLFGAIVGSTVTATGGGAIHYDLELQHATAGGFACTATEVSHATPVRATIAGADLLVQGTVETPVGAPATLTTVASVARFVFPYLLGHVRARVATSVAATSAPLHSGTSLFDAGAYALLPPVDTAGCARFDGTCRHVFTNTNAPAHTGTTRRPGVVALGDGVATAIGAAIAPASRVPGIGPAQWQAIVRAVLAAPLGGVDHSTVAVVEPSAVAAAATRPTMAYFGAADGMLHAVCASAGGSTPSTRTVCPRAGTELWAFLPRVELPLIASNTARIEGSPHVVDAFGSFGDAVGRRFHTILVFQTGHAPGASYALDVTDPAAPVLLWEATAPDAPRTWALGTGLGVATGTVQVDGQPVELAFLETDNGGRGGSGVVTSALALETGAPLWQFGHAYATPVAGIPGGAVAVDLDGQGLVTDVVFGDLSGALWRVGAADGKSRNGDGGPLFAYSTHAPIGAPPVIEALGVRGAQSRDLIAMIGGGATTRGESVVRVRLVSVPDVCAGDAGVAALAGRDPTARVCGPDARTDAARGGGEREDEDEGRDDLAKHDVLSLTGCSASRAPPRRRAAAPQVTWR